MPVTAAGALIEILLASTALAAQPEGRSVLKAAETAMGRLNGSGDLEAIGKVDSEGRTGDHVEVVRPADGAFTTRDRFALFTEAEGYDGHTHWKEDRSGGTHLLNAPFTVGFTVTEAWVRRRGYLQPGSARLESVEHESIGDRSATVLTMQPRGGNPVRLAFDDASHLLVRLQWDRPLNTITESYGDYRRVRRAMMPFTITTKEEESSDTQSVRLTRYVRLAARRSRFSRPPPPRDIVMREAAVLPLESAGYAVVPAEINGHPYNFVLDTGGHDILLPEVATAIGLRTEGKGFSGGSGPGVVASSDAQVARLKFGSATLTNQHFAVLDLGTGFQSKGQPPRAGILGLEIFERMAVTIDEPHNRLIIEPFRAERVCEGDRIPLLFDDDQPAVRGTIDGIPAQIGIDVGNGGPPIVLWRWAEAHKVADRYSQGTKGEGHGVGGSNVTFRTPHHDVVIGRIALRDVDVNYATTKTGYFSSRADSMNLGRALLQKYAVRFDYAAGYMCVMNPKS